MFSLLQEAATTAVEHSDGAVAHDAATGDVVVTGSGGVRPGLGDPVQAVGLPQLDLTTFANQIFWLVVTLVVLYLVLSRVALPRIAAVLSDRQGAVTGDLMAAEEFKLKAREAEAAYDKALADARAEAQTIIAANKVQMQAQLDAAIAKAEAEIAARAAESETRIREIRVSSDIGAREVAGDVAADLIRAFGGQADDAAIAAALDAQMSGGSVKGAVQ